MKKQKLILEIIKQTKNNIKILKEAQKTTNDFINKTALNDTEMEGLMNKLWNMNSSNDPIDQNYINNLMGQISQGSQTQPTSDAAQITGNDTQQAVATEEAAIPYPTHRTDENTIETAPQSTQANDSEMIQYIHDVTTKLLGANNRELATQYPNAYEATVNLKRSIQSLLNIDIQDETSMEPNGLFQTTYEQLPPLDKKNIESLVSQAVQVIQKDFSNLNAGNSPVDQKIQTLQKSLNAPVTFANPHLNNQITNAVLTRLKPSYVEVKTNLGNVTGLQRNDPRFNKFVESITPLGWDERLDIGTQLRSLFQEKEQKELIKMAIKLDVLDPDNTIDKLL